MTAAQVREIVNPDVSFDPAYYSGSLELAEETIIKPILTKELYDDVVADPARYVDLLTYVFPALAYATAFMAYEKDLERHTANQGIMENNTQYSVSAKDGASTRTLSKVKDNEFTYCKRLGQFLIDNADDYPLFDQTVISYEPNLRRFFPI